MSSSSRRPTTARDRAIRQVRIFGLMQQGWSYDAIADAEGLSQERIRQIVKETLEGRGVDPRRDHQRLQLARLDPALRLAAEKVATGDIKAIDRLIRVLNQMDKYQRGAGSQMASLEDEDEARERILAKLSDPDGEPAADADEEGGFRELLLAKLAMVDQRRAALAEENLAPSPEAAGAGAGGRSEAADDSVSKFFGCNPLIFPDSAKQKIWKIWPRRGGAGPPVLLFVNSRRPPLPRFANAGQLPPIAWDNRGRLRWISA